MIGCYLYEARIIHHQLSPLSHTQPLQALQNITLPIKCQVSVTLHQFVMSLTKQGTKPSTRSTSTSSLNEDGSSKKGVKEAEEIENLNDLWQKMKRMIDQSNVRIENKIESCSLELGKRIDNIEQQLATARTECASRTDELSGAIDTVRYDLSLASECIERTEKSHDLIFSGIPYLQSENLKEIFQKIANSLSYGNSEIPLVSLKRLARLPIAPGSNPPIACQFALLNERDAFYRKYLSLRTLNLSNIGFDNGNRIFVNENLTQRARAIRAEALKLKKDGRIQQVSTRNGVVFVKTRRSTTNVECLSVEQLHNIAN